MLERYVSCITGVHPELYGSSISNTITTPSELRYYKCLIIPPAMAIYDDCHTVSRRSPYSMIPVIPDLLLLVTREEGSKYVVKL